MKNIQVVLTYEKKKQPERICNMYEDATGNRVMHGDDTWFHKDGKVREKANWIHGKKEGIEILNYNHKEAYDKRYLFRTFKNGITNGVEVYFHKN